MNDDGILQEIEACMGASQFSRTLFRTAKDYIFTIMYNDSFLRFLKNGSISHALSYKLKRTASSLPKVLIQRFLQECRNNKEPWKDMGIRKGVHLFQKKTTRFGSRMC